MGVVNAPRATGYDACVQQTSRGRMVGLAGTLLLAVSAWLASPWGLGFAGRSNPLPIRWAHTLPAALGVVLLFGLFWKDNLWHKSDAEWIRKAGGLATGEHVPSRRFNFGEKVWFWLGLSFFGLVMILMMVWRPQGLLPMKRHHVEVPA